MKRYVFTLLTVGSVGLAALIGCAEGSEVDALGQPVQGDTTTDDSPTLPSKLPPKDHVANTSNGGTSNGGTSSGKSSSGDTSNGGTSSGSSGTSSGDGGTSSGSTPTCSDNTTCQSATDLGELSGDTGTAVLSAEGTTSQWFKVWLREDSSAPIDLTLRATLTSPPGSNYDLFVYASGCSTPTDQSTSTSDKDTAGVSIPDVPIFGDDQSVWIEVRYVSGPCDGSAKWTLKVQ